MAGSAAAPPHEREAGWIAVAVAGLRRRLVVVTVTGWSMRPTFVPGERVLVRRAPATAVRRGQVVVFEEPDEDGGWPGARDPAGAAADDPAGGPRWMIKRAVAIPGDPVPPDLVPPRLADRPEATVPAGHLVVLGDNPAGSFDSRSIGYVPGDRVLGVVIRRLGQNGGDR